VLRADVEYLLEPVARGFDVLPLAPHDCVTAWAGLRPLLAEPGKPVAELSRRDEITTGPAGVLTIAGGKLTGYRKMGEDVVERVATALGRKLAPPTDSATPLPGGDFDGDLAALAGRVASRSRVGARCAARLVRLYGTETDAVLDRGAEPLAPGTDVVAGEVDWAVDVEGALDLADFVYRRTRAALYDPDARETLVRPAATRMAVRLGWSDAHTADQEREVHALLAADLAFREESS
jgi:glycerol-3-phosphate dehydrogenase